MGHLYIKRKIRGLLFILPSLIIVLGALLRYMSVLFALANVREVPRQPRWNPWDLIVETWQLEHKTILILLAALGLVWILSVLDITFLLKDGGQK